MFSYVFLTHGYGKLDLKFVHGWTEIEFRSNEISLKKVYTSEAKVAEKNRRTTSFGEKVSLGLVADTFTLVSNCCRK